MTKRYWALRRVSTPPSPSTVRTSDGDGAANGVETDAFFKLGRERRHFGGR